MLPIWLTWLYLFSNCVCEDILGCGGFLKSNFSINYSRVEVKLYTKQGSLKYQTDCAPNNGYYLIPVYDRGHFILKIEPPPGWKFHPSSVPLHIDGKTDLCTQNKDINFAFMGFTVFGKVISGTKSVGPAGIQLTLENPAGEPVQVTESGNEGTYSFSPVLPGHYFIKASHNKWSFEQHVEEIEVRDDNVKTKNNIIIAGFDVQGHVFSEGEPVQGVNFLLFSKKKPSKKVPMGCNKKSISSFNQKQDGHYLCYVTSTNDGSFTFPCLPPGTYTLVPFYKGEHIEFDVSPPQVQFEVEQQSFVFKERFQVQGFSVSGQVLTSADGKGISEAKIFVNGEMHAVTDANGVYHLENMRTGTYNITVNASNMLFDPVIRKITPNTPRLPDIFATKYLMCGQIRINKYPPAVPKTDKILIVKDVEGKIYGKLLPDQSGKMLCSFVHPGKYIVEPNVSSEESTSGLKFIPSQHVINISDSPALDIAFIQFLATVTGKIKCIEKCGSLTVRIVPADDNDSSSHYMETKTSSDGKFHFNECMPGRYIISVYQEFWCFQTKTKTFDIVDKNVTDLDLTQSGFQATVIVSHSSSFKVKYPSGQVHSLTLQNAKNVLCLPESGIYHFIPAGCHLFKSDVFKFDTSHPSDIQITPIKHLVTGTVMAALNVSDVKVSISKSKNGSIEHLLLEKPIEKVNNFYKYVFSVFVEPNSDLRVTATSAQMLFHPPVAFVKVQDDCIDDAVEIIGKEGLFIHGSVKPELENVKIAIMEKTSGVKVAETLTHVSGTYSIGPLDSEGTYIVTAEKEGYFFMPRESFTDFTSHKLAEIVIEVTSHKGSPLPGVLLSLSGGKDYRKNSLTRKNGKVSFSSLGPGQYFVRPMLKEFQFQPPTKMIEVKEGMKIEVKISGKRVAYSVFGIVSSPTGESEVGVVMEASGVGDDECLQHQEEAVTEEGGLFRIRGLHPRCEYSVRLKEETDVNQHIMRATPSNISLKVQSDDIMDIHFIAFRHFSQVSISGNVITKQEYLHTLKVKMYNVDIPDQVLHTINLSKSGFFFLPSIIPDEKFYTIQLDSSLPSSSYFYEEQKVTFCANTSFLHYTFTFEPHPRPADQEIVQGSILALPLSVLFAVIIYNHVTVLKLALQTFQVLSSFVCAYHSSSSGDSSSETVGVRRKLKPRKMN